MPPKERVNSGAVVGRWKVPLEGGAEEELSKDIIDQNNGLS